LCRARDERLKEISAKINQRSEQAAAPVRRTIMSDVINPMNMQKKQIRNGIMPTVAAVPDAKALSSARREISNTGKSLN
jgi:hypothetical protein